MTIFLATFAEANSVMVDAATAEDAQRLIAEAIPDAAPLLLFPIPAGIVLAEVRWPDAPDAFGEDNPANVSAAGVVLEPFDAFADYLEACEAVDDESEAAARARVEAAPSTAGADHG